MTIRRTLSTFTLTFIVLFTTSGGPVGTEGLVADAGPGMALLILTLIPVFWCLPEALIVAELGSMLPVEGGYYRWVQRAFGDFWAFQNGWITWLYSLVDMAVFPVLFNIYLAWFLPELTPFEKWSVSLVFIWGATAINLRGALPVGRIAVVSGIFIMGVFAVVVATATPQVHQVPWHPFVKPESSTLGALGVAISTGLWNYIGWDNASTVQGEVHDASRAYPRAIAFALPLAVLGYLLPLLSSLGATDAAAWHEGSWPAIAGTLAGPAFGPVLASLVAVAGMTSALVLFNTLLLTYSRIVLVMAQDRYLPRRFAGTDARGTPRNAVLFAAVGYSLFALAPFRSLIVADVLLYAIALLLELASLYRLRGSEPELRGVFRIPVGRTGVLLLTMLPAAIVVLNVSLSLRSGEYGLPAIIASAIGIALGPLLYAVLRRRMVASEP